MSDAQRPQKSKPALANLQSLPNELLEDIIDIICKNELLTPHRQQLQLSHISRRFREVTTGETRLWSHITFKSAVEWVETLLRRSGSHGLIIDLSDHHTVTWNSHELCRCPDMVSRALVHKDRWKELRLGARFSIPVHKALTSLLTGITLPSLRRLTFPEDGRAYFGDGRLCSSWEMPALEDLSCNDYVCQIPYDLRTPLKSFRYTEHLGKTISVDMTLDLLETQSVSSVEELTLRFTLPLVDRVNAMYRANRMENLRSLTIDFTTRTPTDATKKFFDYLDLPALEVFEFKHDRSWMFASDDMSSYVLLQPYLTGLSWLLIDNYDIRTRYPKLKNIHITIDKVENENLCERLRTELDARLRDAWFGEGLKNASEGEYAKVVENAPRVHYWIQPRPGLRQAL